MYLLNSFYDSWKNFIIIKLIYGIINNVIISSLNAIKVGLNSRALPPGIFHAKSLTANDELIARHQQMKNNGIIITSLDEEGGLLNYDYETFARERYSSKTIEQSTTYTKYYLCQESNTELLFAFHSFLTYKCHTYCSTVFPNKNVKH